MRITIFSVLFLICLNPAYSCINEFSINAKGDTTQLEDHAVLYLYETSFDKKEIEEWLANYDLKKISSYKLEKQSDIAVQLLKLGEFEEAVKIFERLVAKNPYKYEFNANLGTTYELLGKNKLALKYIKKGIEINPDAHNGSEWIHVKILEAKVALEKNPNWLRTHKIVDLEAEIPIIQEVLNKAHQEEVDSSRVFTALMYNLHEQLQTRLPYAPSPDLFMALLYEELAIFTGNYVSTSRAHGYATFAKYFAPNAAIQTKLGLLIDEYKTLTEQNYGRIFDTDELPELVGYLDTTNFYLGKNGVHWLKVDEHKRNALISNTEPNNSKTGWLIAFIAIIIASFFLWRMVIRNSKELDNFE